MVAGEGEALWPRKQGLVAQSQAQDTDSHQQSRGTDLPLEFPSVAWPGQPLTSTQ